MPSRQRAFFTELLARADVMVDGDRPWDVSVHDDRLWTRLLLQGTLGLGESYMDGWWDTGSIDQLIAKVVRGNVQAGLPRDLGTYASLIKGVFLNLQRMRITEVGEKHYDIGDDLYGRMLDPRMIYSCGYWADATDLASAQEAKLDLICRKIGLKPGMRVLDVGSGWGGFLKFAAERYGVTGLGVTVSKNQAAYANAHRDGLPIETQLLDYQSLTGRFDRIVSIGMFEHVGYKNYRAYFEKLRTLLAPDGLFLLHTIGGDRTSTHGEPWTEKYIFPNGMLPSVRQIATATEGVFAMEDWHNFGADYDRTLMAWHQNFEAAWPELRAKYGDRFYRMWRYYLLTFAAMFRERKLNLWQVVLSPDGVVGGYRSVR